MLIPELQKLGTIKSCLIKIPKEVSPLLRDQIKIRAGLGSSSSYLNFFFSLSSLDKLPIG
jgi:hypothetical protein